MANTFIKNISKLAPFTTSQSILDYCGNKSVLRAIFPVLLKDRKVKIQLGNMVKSEYFQFDEILNLNSSMLAILQVLTSTTHYLVVDSMTGTKYTQTLEIF